MKKLIIILFSLFLTSGLWAQKAFSAKITSKDNNEFFVKENNGNYFVTFEVDNINIKQLTTLESSIKNSRGVLNVTTSEIDKKTYFFKVEFYKFATSKRYYAGFFKRNNIKKLLIDNKVIYPDELIEKK
ncbi:MAG: hypothetical protein DRP35_10155, partial [Candidatus Zixiibacteriota bacterium]